MYRSRAATFKYIKYMKYKILEKGKYKSTNTVRKILCNTVTIFIVTVKMYSVIKSTETLNYLQH